MKSFKGYVKEEKVNYNHFTKEWQVRGDEPHHPFKYQQGRIILKGVKPNVDADAYEGKKSLYAYLQGTPTKDLPANHRQRLVKFQKDNPEVPFVHADDNTPVTHADYVEFHGNRVIAHYKK